jgi:Pathogenicity locus
VAELLKQEVLKEFRQIPGVGKRIAEDLWNLGLRSINDLQGQDPEALYNALCRKLGMHLDRCMLSVLRCAVYYVSHEAHNPYLLQWWNWKDGK